MILISEETIISLARGRDHRGLQIAPQLPGVQRPCILSAPHVFESADSNSSHTDESNRDSNNMLRGIRIHNNFQKDSIPHCLHRARRRLKQTICTSGVAYRAALSSPYAILPGRYTTRIWPTPWLQCFAVHQGGGDYIRVYNLIIKLRSFWRFSRRPSSWKNCKPFKMHQPGRRCL